jgi:hypothetical protein
MPTVSLFYFPVLLSVILSSMIQLGFQMFFYFNIQEQSFYTPFDPVNEETGEFYGFAPSYCNTVLFWVANF